MLWDEWQEMLPPTTKAEYNKWCDLYSLDKAGSCFEAFKSLSRGGFTNYKEYILNYFNPGCRETNGPTEGLNNLIERVNREGNGYGFRHLRAKVLYSSLIHERVQYTFDKHSVRAWTPSYQFMTFGDYKDTGYYSNITSYRFSARTEQINIPVANGLSDNTALFGTLDSEGNANIYRHIDEGLVCRMAEKKLEEHEWWYVE